MALTAAQDKIHKLMVRQQELLIERGKIRTARDADIQAAHDTYYAAKAARETTFDAAVVDINTELEAIADKLAGLMEIK